MDLKFNKNYFEESEMRIDKIDKLIATGEYNLIIEHLFVNKDINKIKQILENELFFENIRKFDIERFEKNKKNITIFDFKEEYKYSSYDGFAKFLMMLKVH